MRSKSVASKLLKNFTPEFPSVEETWKSYNEMTQLKSGAVDEPILNEQTDVALSILTSHSNILPSWDELTGRSRP